MNNSSLSTPANSPDAKPLIIIVEDDMNHLNVLEEYLTQRGFNIHSVNNPVTALNQVKKHNPDIILIEIQMVQLRGESVIKALRKNGITIPIIVVSGEISMDIIIELREFDVRGFFIKPVELEKLEAKIRSILSLKEESAIHKTTKSFAGKKKNLPPSFLIITENVDIKEDPYTLIPRKIYEKHGFKIIYKTNYQDAIEALKKSQNNIQMILVKATNEAQTKIIAKLLNIIVRKLKIPVYFIADGFSKTLQNSLNELGFVNLISLQETSPKDIIAIFNSLLIKQHEDTRFVKKQKQIDIIRDLKVIKTLPPIPDIYYKVEKLADDPKSTSADYSKILELDIDITARLLRMSNSTFFSFKREILSVKDAVTLMGTGEIISLVRLSYITGNLNVSPKIESAVKKIWEHSATCAITAKLIYDKTNICEEKVDEDILFTSGIIHDIGKIVLWKFFPSVYSSFLLNPATGSHPGENEENRFMGVSHGEVGKVLAEHWKLPESLTNVIALHHKPMLKPESGLLKIIHISDIVSNLTMNIIQKDQVLDNDPELEKIGYTSDMIHKLTNDLEPVIREKQDLVLKMITG